MKKKIIIVGGGAAGFFSAINMAEKNPDYQITILEKSNKTLAKVRISGGGRCNVTHACFKPYELVKNYPRGEKELLGPFNKFNPLHTIEWFARHGVKLKTESDGRMFPVSNKSQTIVDCFEETVRKLGIKLLMNHGVKQLLPEKDKWKVITENQTFESDVIIITTGSSPQVWKMLSTLGHKIISPVPSLFTFNISDIRIKDLPGLSVPNGIVKIQGEKLVQTGPVLITHWGLSGPAILKLSAWGARILEQKKYRFSIHVNWTGIESQDEVRRELNTLKNSQNKHLVINTKMYDIPKRLWASLVSSAKIPEDKRWIDLGKKDLNRLHSQLTESIFDVTGKSTFKDEFVTAGGIDLKEVDFRTFESRKHKNLFFAGEVLNIDAITGGFNFQNAWTGGWVISERIG